VCVTITVLLFICIELGIELGIELAHGQAQTCMQAHCLGEQRPRHASSSSAESDMIYVQQLIAT
jgi:hypothetical protein